MLKCTNSAGRLDWEEGTVNRADKGQQITGTVGGGIEENKTLERRNMET